MRLEGANDDVYPIVTGTFGGVDFLHSVTGEGKPRWQLYRDLLEANPGGSLG